METLVGTETLPRVKPELLQVPEELASLDGMFRTQFKLLKVHVDDLPTRSALYDMYGHDLTLLQDMLAALDATIDEAIRAAVVFGERARSRKERKESAAQLLLESRNWGRVEGGDVSFELEADLAAQDDRTIALELRHRLELSLSYGLRKLNARLQELVRRNYIGVVRWKSADVCEFSFFDQESRTVYAGQQEVKDAGGRTTMVDCSKVVLYRVRHVHHLIDAQLVDLDAYEGAMPRSIKRYLRKVPTNVRPLLQVLDGRITKEEKCLEEIGSREKRTLSMTFAMLLHDPGISIGNYVLRGWNVRDVTKEMLDLCRSILRPAIGLLFVATCVSVVIALGMYAHGALAIFAAIGMVVASVVAWVMSEYWEMERLKDEARKEGQAVS